MTEELIKIFQITCFARGGRRRGGHRWPEGVTELPAEEMTGDLLEALEADPLFQITVSDAVPIGASEGDHSVFEDTVRANAIDAAIRALPAEAFGADGVPNMKVINAALPEGVAKAKAADRDAILVAMRAEGWAPPGTEREQP